MMKYSQTGLRILMNEVIDQHQITVQPYYRHAADEVELYETAWHALYV